MPEPHATTVTRLSDHELAVTRIFDAPPATVWDAWTCAELFRQWWAPASMGAAIVACEIDARPGGGYRLAFAAPGGGDGETASFYGVYCEATPPARLAWTNDETAGGPLTTVTFEPDGARTRLTLAERYPTPEPVAEALAGLEVMAPEQFAQLDALLAQMQAETSAEQG